jgi:SET domain-containing protein
VLKRIVYFAGYGLFANTFIRKGTHIGNYEGELISEKEGNRRLNKNEENKGSGSYLFFFKEKGKTLW